MLLILLIACMNVMIMGLKLRIVEFLIVMDDTWKDELKLEVCASQNLDQKCCKTSKALKTHNRWENSEKLFFIGRSLQECENFIVEGNVSLTLYNIKGNISLIVSLYGSDFGYGENNRESYICYCESLITNEYQCNYQESKIKKRSCNGDLQFCNFKFNNFTFIGTHKAGTGEESFGLEILNCAFNTQDMNVKEQLDYGIRYFDLGTIYSNILCNCDGLSLGAGDIPSLGTYFCYGLLKDFLNELKNWLNDTGNNDVVVLYFNQIDIRNVTLPLIKNTVKSILMPQLNSDFKKFGHWPTLGRAIQDGKNIFVFIKYDMPVEDNYFVNVRAWNKQTSILGEISMASTEGLSYKKNCDSVVDNAKSLCDFKADFVELDIYGIRLPQLQCLWTYSPICNPRLNDTINACISQGKSNDTINFIKIDFPNYPGKGSNIVPTDLIHELNNRRI